LSLSFDRARLSGFPFRLDLDLTGARLSEPSGWAVSSPHLKAEAYLISPGHWVAVSPAGVTVTRRGGGPLVVTARVLRASLSDIKAHPARISVEGLDLSFSTPRGARPFFLKSAREFHLHTRAGPDDQGAIYVGVEGGTATSEGLADRIVRGGPVSVVVDGLFSHASAMAGADWPASLKAWSRAGGAFSVRAVELSAGAARLKATRGALTAGADGRLAGELKVSFARPDLILAALDARGRLSPGVARTAGLAAGNPTPGVLRVNPPASLDFEAGRVTLGPAALGASPQLF
jgi:hypothetical protein